MSLVIADPTLKIIAKYNKKHRKYEIEVNGNDYFSLPYEAPNFLEMDDDEEGIDLIKGKITCNGIIAMNTEGYIKKATYNLDDQDQGSPWDIDDL